MLQDIQSCYGLDALARKANGVNKRFYDGMSTRIVITGLPIIRDGYLDFRNVQIRRVYNLPRLNLIAVPMYIRNEIPGDMSPDLEIEIELDIDSGVATPVRVG